MLYTVTCNPALDWVMRLDSFDLGATNRSQAETLSLGGKGVNVSVVASRLGLSTCATGYVAGITGQALEHGLADSGLTTDFVHLSGGQTRINTKLLAWVEGTPTETEINGRGPDVTPADQTALIGKLATLTADDIVVLSGSVAPGCDDNFYLRIIDSLPCHGVPVVLDCTGDLLMNTLQAKPFLIKPNNEELAAIAGCDPHDNKHLIQAAMTLARHGARYVLISSGAAGAALVDALGLVMRARAPHGTPVNSVGAGDAMVAGFLAGYYDPAYADTDDARPDKKRLLQALTWGIAAGSATAFTDGIATREEVMRLLPAIEVIAMR